MEPTLNKLSASAKELQAVAPKQAEDVWTRVEALKQFTVHIQELSSLENTLMEPYEVSSFNVGNFSKKIVEKVKGDIQPEVNLVTDVPQLEIKTNAEHLEQVLLHLLKNAALYTSSGNIRLEFKRKGAHVCQLAGNANHVAIGSDLDGAFGTEQCPYDLVTIADLQKIFPILQYRGFTDDAINRIASGNWIEFLRKHLPE